MFLWLLTFYQTGPNGLFYFVSSVQFNFTIGIMKLKKLLLLFIALPFLYGFSNIAHRGDNELGKYAEHSFLAYDHAATQGAWC